MNEPVVAADNKKKHNKIENNEWKILHAIRCGVTEVPYDSNKPIRINSSEIKTGNKIYSSHRLIVERY